MTADNPTSSAYGIPQALTSMHDLPADYMTSAEAQIRWGLEYIQDSYGTPVQRLVLQAGQRLVLTRLGTFAPWLTSPPGP